MGLLGWLIFAVLTALASLSALSVARLSEPEGRAETLLVALLLLWAALGLPVLALGYAGLLYRLPVAVLSAALSVAGLAVCARASSVRGVRIGLRDSLLSVPRLVADAFGCCFEARSFALLGSVSALGVLAFTLFLTWLAPADESWDGLYYHQPIVGFALQQHGFGLVELPSTLLAQTINGYPKFGEAFSLWFVLFTDKTLIEIGSVLAAPGMMLAVYLILRRYTADRASCIGWACVLLLLPALSSQLRTTMIDIELWFFALSAAYFATRPVFRARDAALALLGCALVVGTKSTGLVLAPPLLVVVLLRTLRHVPRSRWLPAVLPGFALVVSIGALTFARNWHAFHNPFWPISYQSRTLGWDFHGLATLSQVSPDPSFGELVSREFDHPAGGVHDIIVRSYGYAVPWVVLPLGALGLLYCVGVAARGRLRRTPDALAESLLLLAAVLGLPFLLTPSLANARYNVQVVVLAIVLLVWASERASAERLREGALASSTVLSLMAMIWSGYLWGLNLHWQDIGTLLSHSKNERASLNFSKFQMPAEVARLREAELGPGEVAAFTRELTFIGVLWNDTFSNRVSYLASNTGQSLLTELEQLHARWVAVGGTSAARKTLEHSGAYELVGVAAQTDNAVIFRRR